MAIKLINGAEFLHLPKTGGSWVTEKLESNNLIASHFGHMHANYDLTLYYERIRKMDGRQHLLAAMKLLMKKIKLNQHSTLDQNTPFRFCFVRNPFSWYESWWKYSKGRDWREFGVENSSLKWHPNSALNGLGSNDFNEFIWNVIKKRPGYVSELFFSYTKPGISMIGRIEHLREDLEYILSFINLKFDKKDLLTSSKINVSKTPSDEIEWDPKLKAMIKNIELPAFIHFGYLSEEEQKELGLYRFIPPNTALITS